MQKEEKVNLSPFTTLKIGGVADLFCSPQKEEELRQCIQMAKVKDVPILVMGRGANLLVGDVEGLVVSTRHMRGMWVREEKDGLKVKVMAGEPLKTLIQLALKENLEGLYRLAGFPATVGGAVAMNAGAFGYEISQHLTHVAFLDWDGRLHRVPAKEINFSYRHSPFPRWGIVVWAEFLFPRSERPVYEEYLQIRERRKKTQPIHQPTCGSTFKNPPGDYAGRLIQLVGLKGYRLGRVAFSEIHANFIINLGGATFQEATELIQIAKDKVYRELGITLEEEVRIVEGRRSDGWKIL